MSKHGNHNRWASTRTFALEDYLMEDILDRIQELDMSLREVETRAGVAKSYITHMLSGKSPTLKKFQHVTEALGLKLVLVEMRT